jgi:hypothetical protein
MVSARSLTVVEMSLEVSSFFDFVFAEVLEMMVEVLVIAGYNKQFQTPRPSGRSFGVPEGVEKFLLALFIALVKTINNNLPKSSAESPPQSLLTKGS